MYKFYVCEFVNNKHPMPDPNKVFIKFGITHHWDVMDRFNPNVDDGYAKNYEDWDITCKFSIPLNDKQSAEIHEQHWLKEVFPNPGPTKVWVESYLGVDSNDHYRDNTGITELRLVTHKQAKWVYYKLHEWKKNGKY